MNLRIAFLTDEFVVERQTSGGLATFLSRIVKSLAQQGHMPEVFVRRSKDDLPDVIDFSGVRVELVRPVSTRMIRRLSALEQRWLRPPWGGSAAYLSTALGLSRALEKRHRGLPFDVVHTTNCSASGLFVAREKGRLHMIRLSSHRKLYWETDGEYKLGHRLMAMLERAAIRRADIAYAPSQCIADHCLKTGWRRDVHVVRPPAFLETDAASEIVFELPDKFLVHFGRFRLLKGTDVVLSALRMAWAREPDLCMVLAGTANDQILKQDIDNLQHGSNGRLVCLGALKRNVLYGVVKRATAAVLPSRADNLPNTVIESLLLGTPVIGSRGASIDELVEPGVSGELVDIGDVNELADTMLRAWRGEGFWAVPHAAPLKTKVDLNPDKAIQELVDLFTEGRSKAVHSVAGR